MFTTHRTETDQKVRFATFQRISTNVPGFLRFRSNHRLLLGRLSQFFEKWFFIFLKKNINMKFRKINSPTLDRAKIDLPLFGELGQTSQDSSVSDQIPDFCWDVCPNSPKSGKSILFEKVASRFCHCWSSEFCHHCFAIFPLFGILSGPEGVHRGGYMILPGPYMNPNWGIYGLLGCFAGIMIFAEQERPRASQERPHRSCLWL